ncbi:MAG: O-methyltransferase [Bacteroidales bacterium]
MNRIPRAIVIMLVIFSLAEFAAIALVARTTARRVGAAQAATKQETKQDPLDARVRKVLDDNRYGWRDMNVPEADGRALYDLVLKNGYKRALEIGTSTGHSGIWIAWALSKTGGRLITIDIDEGRYREAKKNFEAAGLAPFIDARLADAHDLVPKLDGPFDFVFIDADKDWYTTYAKAVLPKLTVGGSMTAHNVSPRGGRRQMTGDYYEYVAALPFLESTFSAGVLVSRKVRER